MLKLKLQYLVICCKQTTHLKNPWCWERLRAEREEGVRGWDGWTASWIQWTWTCANSRRWWGTGRPGVLQSMGLRRVGHNLAMNNKSAPQLRQSSLMLVSSQVSLIPALSLPWLLSPQKGLHCSWTVYVYIYVITEYVLFWVCFVFIQSYVYVVYPYCCT